MESHSGMTKKHTVKIEIASVDSKKKREYLLSANARTKCLTGYEPAGPCEVYAISRDMKKKIN
jgi:hypothetical protein